MNLFILIIFSLIIFLAIFVGGRKYRSTALYALAIGGIVNANLFTAYTYPIKCFGLSFGIDSIIYTLFVFCVVIMYFEKGRKEAYLLSISSVVAIVISAIFQLISELMSKGNNITAWMQFLSFLVSAIASIIAIAIMIEILERIKSNKFLLLIIGIVVASTINMLIYYPLSMLINGVPENIWILLLTSFIGRIIALASSLFALFLLNIFNIKFKENSIK